MLWAQATSDRTILAEKWTVWRDWMSEKVSSERKPVSNAPIMGIESYQLVSSLIRTQQAQVTVTLSNPPSINP